MISTLTLEQNSHKKANEHDHAILSAFLKKVEKQLFTTEKYQFDHSFFVIEKLKIKEKNQTTSFKNNQSTERYQQDLIEILVTQDNKSHKIVKIIVKINCTRKDIIELQPTNNPIEKMVTMDIEVSDEGIVLSQKLSFAHTFNRQWKGMLTVEKHVAYDNSKQFFVFYKRVKENNPKDGIFTHMSKNFEDAPTRLDNLLLVIQSLHLIEANEKARELFQMEGQESEDVVMLLLQKSFNDLNQTFSLFEMITH